MQQREHPIIMLMNYKRILSLSLKKIFFFLVYSKAIQLYLCIYFHIILCMV